MMKTPIKVLLANPSRRSPIGDGREKFFIVAGSRWPFSIEKRVDEHSGYMPFPFYLAYTAGLLEKEPGVQVFVRDSIAMNETQESFLTYYCNIHPDIVLFETATGTVEQDAILASVIKSRLPNVVIVFAGVHVSALPRETAALVKGSVDFLILREYEVAFLRLVRSCRDGMPINTIPSLVDLRQGNYRANETYEPVDINTLPFPARHLFPTNEAPDMDLYWDGFIQEKPSIQMHASRGCPFRCDFCTQIHVMYDAGRYRIRPARDICNEIEQCMRQFGTKHVYFDDDTFTGNKRHVLEFCDEVVERQLHKRVSWSAMADFMITDGDMLLRMKEAGCTGLKFGIESGSKEVLRGIGKPINPERLIENCNLCSKLGIKTHGTITLGGFLESKTSMTETFEFAKKLNCDTIQVSITTPFPGTPLFDKLRIANRLATTDWREFDGLNCCVIKYDQMNPQDVVAFHATFTQRWIRHKLTQPAWVWRHLKLLAKGVKSQGPRLVMLRIRQTLEALKG
jgi:radical SAM superfamily enzyme YgiQ (UPF0313 family)